MDSCEFLGEVFSIGDHVRVMTEEEAAEKYGRDDSGLILLPSGPYDYRRLGDQVGGMDFIIEDIKERPGLPYFIHSFGEGDTGVLSLWRLDAEICVKFDYDNPIPPDEEFDPDQLTVLLGR